MIKTAKKKTKEKLKNITSKAELEICCETIYLVNDEDE